MRLFAALIEAVHILRIEAEAWESQDDPGAEAIKKRYTAVANELEAEVSRRRNSGQLPWPVRACIVDSEDASM